MTPDFGPSESDLTVLTTAQDSLSASGLAPGRGGYDLSTVAAAVYARGWTYGIDRVGGNFQAEIRSHGQGAQFHITGVGWTADSALTLALARALDRPGMRQPAAAEPATQAAQAGADNGTGTGPASDPAPAAE